jgi:hypothetical protein
MSPVEGTCAIGQTSYNVTNPNTIPFDVGLICWCENCQVTQVHTILSRAFWEYQKQGKDPYSL